MGKSAILSVGLVVVAAMVVCGCATAGKAKGKSDPELIKDAVNEFKAGMQAKNVDQLMAMVSDQFSHPEWGDKASLKTFIQDNVNQGNLDDAEVDLSKAETKIQDGTATVYPVGLVATFGSATIEFKMKKEADGKWRAVGLEVEGI